jgi:uncharacterized protein (DUF362 family)
MQFIYWEQVVASQDRVLIKPNFTYPMYKPGVSTSPLMIEAVVELLKTRTAHIAIVESDCDGFVWTVTEALSGHVSRILAPSMGLIC